MQVFREETIPVTVCVAAIYENNAILGASDRMLTAGDIQFEPQQTKIYLLTTSIAIMLAGDSFMQAEIMEDVRTDVNKEIEKEPTKWWTVRDVAELYSFYYNKARFKKAERSILAPLGLDGNTFITRQQEMNTAIVRQITEELLNYQSPPTSAIITGVDLTGPHIFVANNADISCQDFVGFAAIGVGIWHASSQMMFAGHTRHKPFPETLLTVYSAKRRAEVAPGVGQATDMFALGPALGSYAHLGDDIISDLAQLYEVEQKSEKEAAEKAKENVTRYVEIIRATTAKEQAAVPEDSGGDAPANKETS